MDKSYTDRQIKEKMSGNTVGTRGELFVLDLMKSRGFDVFATNVKGLGYEIDLVVYKIHKDRVDIRLVEVKTRNTQGGSLEYVGLQTLGLKNKILKYVYFGPSVVSTLVESLQSQAVKKMFFSLHIDLAIVVNTDQYKEESSKKSFKLYKYYQNINLLI